MRTERRRGIASVALLLAIAGAPPAEAAAPLPPLPPLAYRLHADYRAPDGTIVRTDAEAPLGAPALLDVDHDPATGVAGDDVAVHVAPDVGGVAMRAVRLLPVEAPLAQPPSPMPLALEAVLADPRPGSSLRVALGYDALAEGAPAVYGARFGIVGAGRGSAFTLEVTTRDPGGSLGVSAGLFEEGPGGARLNPKRGRIGFSPVPASARVEVVADGDEAGVTFAVDLPTRVGVRLEDIEGTAETVADATIDLLPTSLALTISSEGGQPHSATYAASEPVGSIDLRLVRRVGGAIVEEAAIGVVDMPRDVSFVREEDGTVRLTADSPIGRLDLGLASGGPIRTLPDPNAYVYQEVAPGRSSLAVRLFGLSSLEADTADPYLVDVTLAPGPLHVVRRAGASTIDAWVRDLPREARISFSPSSGSLGFDNSDPIEEVTLDVVDPAGVSGRATALHLRARGIPPRIDVSFAEDDGSVSLDAHGQTLGLLEVQLTSGPDERLDPSVDGLLVKDLADRYVVFARLTGLRRVVASREPPDVTLETTGGRLFVLDMSTLDGSKVEYVRGTIDRLVPSMRIRLLETARSRELVYEASAPTNRIVFDTNSGDRWNLGASITGPVPASLRFCASDDGACTGFARPARAGAFSFAASEQTTVGIFDCVRPLNSSCTRTGSPSRFTRVDLRLRHLEADADFSDLGQSGHLFMNTTSGGVRHTMNGSLLAITSSDGGFSASFPSGFWANQRRTDWLLWGLIKTKSGSVNCPSGTSLAVRVLGFWFGVTSLLC